jgi:epoxyqueuosine reductase
VITVALGYFKERSIESGDTGIARYALFPDYHPLIRNKLHELLKSVNQQGLKVLGRAFADSAPVAERYWAEQAGLGWIGKNRQLILPGKGSWFLLGELVTDLALEYDKPGQSRCGSCRRCIEACPGKALDERLGLDARRCLSYLTIEKKGDFNEDEALLCGENKRFFGCDICQEVCPWNRFSMEQDHPDMQPIPDITGMDWSSLDTMTEETFNDLFEGTCLHRSGLKSLRRNLTATKKFRPSYK